MPADSAAVLKQNGLSGRGVSLRFESLIESCLRRYRYPRYGSVAGLSPTAGTALSRANWL